jgi:serine/threonine-protein kinase
MHPFSAIEPELSPQPSSLDDRDKPPDNNRLEETTAYRSAFRPVETGDENSPEFEGLVGSTLGQYRLEELVGRGTMGRVYRAHHLELHRPCALKVMNPGLVSKQPRIRERFWDEARAVANLLHPHVVTIHNLGSDRGFHFIEMEYIPGGVSLGELIIREGPFEPLRATNLVRQVVLALEAAHQSGLVHRDVKPSNVLLTSKGQAKLADFGLVRRVGEIERAGLPIAGTPTYMAPELFEGIPASPSSDLYAVGVMYFYLLSGRLPFASDQIGQLILKHRFATIPAITDLVPSVPAVVTTILEHCLAKRSVARYATAAELASELGDVISELRDTETLLKEIIEGVDCFVQGAHDHYRIVFRLPGERLQEVYFEATRGKYGERLFSVFSVCGAADPAHYEFALRLNDKLSFGSLCVRNVNGQPMFVMNRSFPRDHVNSADIRAAILEIASKSDRVEQQLSSIDLY